VLRFRDILVEPGSVPRTSGSGSGVRIREAQKHTDPDPQHWDIVEKAILTQKSLPDGILDSVEWHEILIW